MKLIGIAAIIIALAVGYYFVIYIPQKDRASQEAQAEQKQEEKQQVLAAEKQRKIDLENCLNAAQEDYSANWSKACKSLNTDTTKEDCGLPVSLADPIVQARKEAKDDCFKQYPQK